MKMINVIVNFRRYIKRRNYSPHTVKYYLSVIRQFVLWLKVPLEQAGFVFGHHPGVLQLP
jgi:hypothetical protein